MYEQVKLPRKNRYTEFTLNDNDGHMIRRIEEKYTDFFNSGDTGPMDRWTGEARAFTKPISREEISAAIKRLHNNRAVGLDGLPAEYFKCARQEVKAE